LHLFYFSVVPRILSHEHIVEKKKVKVQPYYPKFHDAIIKELSESLPLVEDDDDDDDDLEEDEDGYLKQINFKRTEPPEKIIDEGAYASIQSNIQILGNHKEEIPQYDLIYSRTDEASGWSFPSVSSGPLTAGNLRHIPDRQSFDRHDSPIDERQGDGQKVGNKLEIIDEDLHKGKRSNLSPRDSENRSPSKSSNPTEQDHRSMENMQLPKSTVSLLRLTNFNRQHPECRIIFDTSTDCIKITGNQTDVKNTLTDLWKKLDHIKECDQSLTEGAFELLKQMERTSSEFIEITLLANYIKAYVVLSKGEKPMITATALSNKEAQRALKEISSLVQEREISYSEGSCNFMSSDEWSKLSSKLEHKSMVKVKVKKNQKRIIILGFRDDVETAHNEIRQALDKGYTNTGKPIVITGGRAKLFKYCLQDEINKLQGSTRYS